MKSVKDLLKLSSREELDRLVEARSLAKSSSASELFPLNFKGAKELDTTASARVSQFHFDLLILLALMCALGSLVVAT